MSEMPNIANLNEFKEAMENFHSSEMNAGDYMNFISTISKITKGKTFKHSHLVNIVESVTKTEFLD